MVHWWQAASVREDLNFALANVRDGRAKLAARAEIEAALKFADALDTLIFGFRRVVPAGPGERRSDTASLERMLGEGMSHDQQQWLCEREAVLALRHISPPIRDDVLLSRRDFDRARPLPAALRTDAEEKHHSFAVTFDHWRIDGGAPARSATLAALARVIWMVRSNIDHGRKAAGPRSDDERQRDREIARTTRRVMEAALEALLAFPSTMFATYGTLAPDGRNHHLLADVDGSWSKGTVRGFIEERLGLPTFVWEWGADEVEVDLLESRELPSRWTEFDAFEGTQYCRIWVPVERRGKPLAVATLYEGVREDRW